MTNKYRNAILNYEKARLAIKEATKSIRESPPCSKDRYHPLSTCLDTLYKTRRHNKKIDENDFPYCLCCDDENYSDPSAKCICEPGQFDHIEENELCHECKILDDAIQHRKKCKKEFGAAKRALSTIARFELKQIQEGAPWF